MNKFNPSPVKGFSEVIFLIAIIYFSLSPQIPAVLAAEGDLAKGKALYEEYCAVCHGSEGKGDGYTLLDPPPANLTSKAIQKKSNDELRQEVHDGIPDTAMGMWKVALSDEEITMILAYVRTLAQ